MNGLVFSVRQINDRNNLELMLFDLTINNRIALIRPYFYPKTCYSDKIPELFIIPIHVSVRKG